jgi:hypothetical protein
MDDQAPSFNPYEPPMSTTSDGLLAFDTEFLFSEEVVAGVGTILLPPVCVVTGVTTSLVRYETPLWWCSRWITVPLKIVILLALFIGLPLLLEPRSGFAALGSPMMFVLGMAFGLGLFALAFVLFVAMWMRRQSVQVQWYVSKETVRKHNRNCWIIMGITVALMVMSLGSPGAFMGFFVMGAISTIRLMRGPRMLEVIVKRDGLFYVGGMSSEFLKEVRRMADRYDSLEIPSREVQPQQS